ncbi:TonB-dependent receptor [Novosphingobium sp. FKTRR1]|uniref:TonB-dependent receptor n=1 Tax=Novosphingobium sp. FKTRR1 TaxID=2879118 RepID=UPI001CEFB99B|nr:TonB-dependent receptor [Novosphingobium sp. FKTRR1]
MRIPARTLLLSASAMACLATGLAATPAFAQSAAPQADPAPSGDSGEIIVTATRRAISLQDVPVNITAVTADSLKNQRVDDIRSLAAFTPGLTIQDTGPRATGTIVMRGLSASDSSTFGDNGNNMLATYLGEIPLYQDFKFIDMNRVEVLLGPQGTLYGVGTMAGAIRYIPNRPDPEKLEATLHARAFTEAHSHGLGYSVDWAVNLPIVEGKIALRTASGYYYDPGFIDYNYLVNTPGVSTPQPNQPSSFFGSLGTPDQLAANLHSVKDANFEKTFTTRNQLGLFPTEGVKVYLSYVHQETSTDGRQSNGGGVFGTGKYEAPWRYLEPANRVTDLWSAEAEIELGDIAELVSATAFTLQNNTSSVDVTDLLIDLDYGYQLFPQFSGYTKQKARNTQFNQELRLVSKHGGPFSWTLGGFFNRQKTDSTYREIVPGFPAWAGIDRPDQVEYASYVKSNTKEEAVFGEVTYSPIKALSFTAGGRYYKYDAFVDGGQALPLFQDYPQINFRSRTGATKDSGTVWKFNASYKFSPDVMVYATYSKGYRIGGVNRVAPCVLPLPPGQNLCALPNELTYTPDTVKNKELGIRYTLFGGKLRGNLSIFKVDWDGIQLDGLTTNGAIGITVNGGKAISQGVELNFTAKPVRGLTINGSYSYTDAHLTEDVPGLLKFRHGEEDAKAGDRLPGSTKNSGSIGVTYEHEVGLDQTITANWTTSYTGDILSRVGARGFGERLPAYTTHRASIGYTVGKIDTRLYIDNIFDKFAVVAVSNDLSRRVTVDGIVSRYYANSILSPRKIGIETTIKF